MRWEQYNKLRPNPNMQIFYDILIYTLRHSRQTTVNNSACKRDLSKNNNIRIYKQTAFILAINFWCGSKRQI